MACCNACKISGMSKKKKHGIGATGGDIVTDLATIGLGVTAGVVVSHELKSYVVPMLYSNTDTEEQKKTKGLYANLGGIVLGGLVVGGSTMLSKGSAEQKGVASIGGGIIGQCMYSLYLNNVKKPNADGSANNKVAGKFDMQLWQAAKQKAMEQKRGINGSDNNSAGVYGSDNSSHGVFGVTLKSPLSTMIDQVGAYRRKGTASF